MERGIAALIDRLRGVPLEARKLFCVVVRQAYRGPMHPKPPGVATPAEILEACGIDVADFYALLKTLAEQGLIEVRGEYPFEEIRVTEIAALTAQIPDAQLERTLVGLDPA